MFCRKCGTEQKEGQKFCPKCGEPYLDEHGRPYEKGIKKDINDARRKVVSEAEKLSQKGQELFSEKIQPQLSEKIEELKRTDWRKKKDETVSYVLQFLNDFHRVNMATRIAAAFFLLWFIIKVGFSASIWWYFVAAAVAYFAFFKRAGENKEKGKVYQYLPTIVCVCLMLITVFGVSSKGDVSDDTLSGGNRSYSGAHEVYVSLEYSISDGKRYAFRGNYGGFETRSRITVVTGEVTIPHGKKWQFDRCDLDGSASGTSYWIPELLHMDGWNGDKSAYFSYRLLPSNKRRIPIFRSGDVIKILYTPSPHERKNGEIQLKVYFTEADDEMYH